MARHLLGDDLSANVRLVLKREHDRADHCHEQNDAGGLEEVDVLCVENEPERLRIRNSFGGGIGAVIALVRRCRSPRRRQS